MSQIIHLIQWEKYYIYKVNKLQINKILETIREYAF